MYKFEEQFILEQLELTKGNKIAFWGASCFLLQFLSKNNIENYNIIGIIDNNSNLEGAIFLKYKIFKPENLKSIPDYIIFSIENNNSRVYEIIKNSVNKTFPNTQLLPNIFNLSQIKKLTSNKIYLIDNFGNKTPATNIPGLDIKFNGINSIVEIGADPIPKFSNCCIRCYDNTYTSIGSSKYTIRNLDIGLNGKLIIGENFSVNGASFIITERPEQTLKIGNDCMFSREILIRTSDAHSLYCNDKKELLNPDNNIEIGDHVWIGQKATILKNTKIANNSVVGACSIVNKEFNEQNVIIAGNPAKIVKHNINWDRTIPSNFI